MYLAEVSAAALALPSPSIGLPPMPPPTPIEVRGVVIHWVQMELPTEGHVMRVSPTVPVQQWARHVFPFSALSTDHQDRAPQTTVEKDAYILLAAYMVLARYSLSPQTTLLWEVCTPVYGAVMFRGRPRLLVPTAYGQKSGSVELSVHVGDTDQIYLLGTTELRGSLLPSRIAVLARRRGVTSVRGSLHTTNNGTAVAATQGPTTLGGWAWATWGTVPVARPSTGASVVLRGSLLRSRIAVLPLRGGSAPVRVNLYTTASIGGPYVRSGFASSRMSMHIQSTGVHTEP